MVQEFTVFCFADDALGLDQAAHMKLVCLWLWTQDLRLQGQEGRAKQVQAPSVQAHVRAQELLLLLAHLLLQVFQVVQRHP